MTKVPVAGDARQRRAGWVHARRALTRHGAILPFVAAPCAVLLATADGSDATAPERRLAITAVLLAVVLGSTAATVVQSYRRPDTRSALMAIAFVAMSQVVLMRTVAMVPGPLYSPGITRLAEVLTIPVGAIVLALSGATELRARRHLGFLQESIPAVAVALLVVGVLPFTSPSEIPAVPRPGSVAGLVLFGLTLLALLLLARRAVRTAELSERRSDLVVAGGTVVAVFASWAILNSYRADQLWWAGHALELVGITAMCVPASRDLFRHAASRPLVGDLRASDIVADEEGYLDGRVHHLLLQLARKDDVTEGHTRRVATLAVEMGERLGLDPASLRDLAAGGLLHDIGKLRTPDEILKKPGSLTDAEYDVIKRHPSDGLRMLAEIGRFSARVLHLVEAHHERLDGAGYPHGILAETLQLEVKILAVADVYDALTSQRPYRPAWPPDRALDLIERDAGVAFDPECVAALRSVVAPKRYLSAAFRRKLSPGHAA